MTAFELLFLIGAGIAIVPLAIIAAQKSPRGNAVVAALLGSGFAAFTAFTIASEGVLTVFTNHSVNFWGIQVWYDLILSLGIALFFIAPRARAAGMKILPWLILVGSTASIGLLAMIARLFWLENSAAEN